MFTFFNALLLVYLLLAFYITGKQASDHAKEIERLEKENKRLKTDNEFMCAAVLFNAWSQCS